MKISLYHCANKICAEHKIQLLDLLSLNQIASLPRNAKFASHVGLENCAVQVEKKRQAGSKGLASGDSSGRVNASRAIVCKNLHFSAGSWTLLCRQNLP
jgi:hypothetical protein